MGIDRHAFHLIARLAREAPLGDVLTIGRQCVDFDARALGFTPPPGAAARYCEWLLLALGARSVASLDVSAYEGATHIADLGAPIDLPDRFDTVIDAGSLEHVFDVATAFRNCIALTRPGGRIAHILPVNNLSGHGFWQFSSDLLHTLYAPGNGFAETRVFHASSLDATRWWEVPAPAPGARTEVVSIEPLILLATTRKRAEVARLSVQQPFYANDWRGAAPSPLAAPQAKPSLRARLRGLAVARWLRNAGLLAGLALGRSRYSVRHRRFTARDPRAP
ncbi:MAG: hypothetical protein A4S12_11835 [Proteobacteria bacterium SG_bin5]|nr:class I SAM-dependent methyltransferase [Sphingomonas sp.]OQW39029.1 MAG: hypothetical protein A4S12_11835 [Proteobacteria bacterium SG_bin5]